MEEILHHLGCIKPCKWWDQLATSTGERRIFSINRISILKEWDFYLPPPQLETLRVLKKGKPSSKDRYSSTAEN